MQIIKKHFNTLHTHAKKHIEKLDAHVQKHAPKLHEHAKKVHAHLSKPAKHHHYWLALCGIILRSSIVTYTNSSFARQSLQDQFIKPIKSIDLIQLEPIDIYNPRSNLTGVYTGGDIIISAVSFTQTLPNGTVGIVNTIDTGSNNPARFNITFKNIGNTPIYIPYINNNGTTICIPLSIYTNKISGGGCANINITDLTQNHYLIPNQIINGYTELSSNSFGIGGSRNGLLQVTLIINSDQYNYGGGWTSYPYPPSTMSIYETNGLNNPYTIFYNIAGYGENLCGLDSTLPGCLTTQFCHNINSNIPGCYGLLPPSGDTLYIYKETKNIFRNQANSQALANYPSCVCDQSAMDTSAPHDCQFNGQTINNGNVGGTIGWTPTNAHYFYSNNVGDYCTDNHNAADGGIDIYQRYVAPNQGTGGNNGNGYGYGYGYGYTNGYGYGYGYGYRYAKGSYKDSPIFYLTKPYLMISQSVWEKYKNINLLPTKMKKIAAGTIEKLFDQKALIEMANELQTSFDRTKQKLETMKTAARSKVQSDYQKARKLFEDGYTALFKKKGLRNKETEQAIKKNSKSENTLTTQVLPSEAIKSKTDTTKQPATANISQTVQDQTIKAPATTKKDGLLKRIKDKMRQLIKDKIKQVKSN